MSDYPITADHFAIFQKTVLKYLKFYGLASGWHVEFWNEAAADESMAWVVPQPEAHRADFYLATVWSEEPTPEKIIAKARHEVLHVVVVDLSHVAGLRYVSKAEIENAEEGLVVRLMAITKTLPRRQTA